MPVQDPWSENIADSTSEEDSSEITVEEGNMRENISNQLDAFEKRLLSDYSTRAILPETELELPTLLINSFSRVFRMWHKNPAFKNSIQSHVFYDIFSLMFRSLNEEPTISSDEQTEDDVDLSNLTGVCDICDEEFEIFDGDAKKSFAKHARTETHAQTLDLLNKIGVSDKIDDDLKQSIIKHPLVESNSEKQSKQAEVDSVLKQNGNFLRLQDENSRDFECCLCDIVCIKQRDLINHCREKTHAIRKSYFLRKPQPTTKKQAEFNNDSIFTRGQYIYCVLCQCIQNKQSRNQHIKNEYHLGWKNFARKVSKLEEPYMYKINENIGFCELCVTEFSLANGIVPHCQKKNHVMLKHFADEIRCLNYKYCLNKK